MGSSLDEAQKGQAASCRIDNDAYAQAMRHDVASQNGAGEGVGCRGRQCRSSTHDNTQRGEGQNMSWNEEKKRLAVMYNTHDEQSGDEAGRRVTGGVVFHARRHSEWELHDGPGTRRGKAGSVVSHA